LERDRSSEVEQPEDGGQRDDSEMRRRRVACLRERLGSADESRDLQHRPPALSNGDHRCAGEHDGDEGGTDLLQAPLEDERRRDDHRADQPERGDNLRLPGK
jgi:hypothetical protein